MEFKIKRTDFLEALARTQTVVEKKNTMPVLSNILLDAQKSGLQIMATDLEVAVLLQVAAQISTEGKITVPCRSLHDIVREITDEEVRITLKEGDRIEVRAGTSLFKIPGLSAQEFPSFPKVEGKSVELPCAPFVRMIDKTAFSMSVDETRHNLAGLCFEKNDDDQIRMVATDGHRLSLVDQPADAKSLGKVKVIIPRKGVAELKKMVSQEGSFELAVGTKNLCARKGNETLYVRLIDGDFPDYNRVIPKSNDKQVLLPKEKFVGALRRVSLLANERSRGVVMSFSEGKLEVSINNPDLGEAREEMEADYKGDKITVGFNAKYFLDVLQAISDDVVQIMLQNDLSPCIISAKKDAGFLCVIMPMRI